MTTRTAVILRPRRFRAAASIVAGFASLALLAASSPAVASHTGDVPLPIIFVHGGAGSAGQYASIAKRFVSNGYPADRIRAYEYDSSSALAIGAAPDGVDALIDQLRAEFGVERVNLVGHSLGTFVSANYLAVPARAAKIAHYVGVDGGSIPTCGVDNPNLDCMGIFRGTTGNVGGNNVYFDGQQSHVEVATSAESFAAQYQFFTGRAPRTTLILPEPPGQVEIAGRAVNFPQNSGVNGGTLRIWEVNPATGHRKDAEPIATVTLGPSGEWGPFKVNGQKHYEFEVVRLDSPIVGHLYYQPFIRDDYWVRLLSPPPGSGTVVNTVTGPDHASAVVLRYREWWTTHPSDMQDVLNISTRVPGAPGQPPVNALTNVSSNGIVVGGSAIGMHVHDNPPDQTSSLLVIPYFATQAFQNGADVYMPATDPANGTITFSNAPRGDASRLQVVRTPNWPSSGHRIAINLNDYVQDINTWGECMRAKPSPCR